MARIQDETSLGPVEQECLRLARAGEPVVANMPGQAIAADAVRFIIETVNTAAGPGGCSVDFRCWRIIGKVNLKGVAGLGYLSLKHCRIEDLLDDHGKLQDAGSIDLEFADLRALDLDYTHLQMLEGMRSRIRGSVYMRKRFRAFRGVDLSGAWIEGSLTCRGSILEADDALVSDGDWSERDWTAHFPFEPNPTARAGERPLKNPFCLNLRHTTIGGTLYLGPKHQQEKDDPTGLCALKGSVDLSGLRVREFVDHETAYEQIAGRDGINPMPRTRHRLVLDGFEYDRFGSTSPKDARYRIDTWLALQPDAFGPDSRRGGGVGEDFHPQPYEQLAKVLKAMGHDLDAKEVQFQRRLRQTLHSIEFARAPAEAKATPLGRGVHAVREWWHGIPRTRRAFTQGYGWMTGFGYKPTNLVLSIIALVVVNSIAMNGAASQKKVVPADEGIAASTWWRACEARTGFPPWWAAPVVGAHRVNDCIKTEPPGTGLKAVEHHEAYPRFNGLFYSIESFFPVLDLNQRAHWTVLDKGWGLLLSWWLALYSMVGWVGTSLLVAGLFARFNQRGGD